MKPFSHALRRDQQIDRRLKMRYDREKENLPPEKPTARWFKFFSNVILLCLVLSCVKPIMKADPELTEKDYQNFRFVYLIAPDSKEQDPRNVYPRLARGLEDLGFKVQPVNKVGQYGEDPMGFEGRVMNKTFEKIRSHFGL